MKTKSVRGKEKPHDCAKCGKTQLPGADVEMYTNPLSDYFHMRGNYSPFRWNSTGLWRCYLGSWKIVADRLYLIGLVANFEDGTDASLATIFPEFPDRVFAHWYTGTIRLPQGKQLHYVLTPTQI